MVDANGTEYWLPDPAHADYAPDEYGGVNSVRRVADGQWRAIEEGMEVFEFHAPDAGYVNLAGDFNGWNQGTVDLKQGSDGTWRCRVRVDPPVTYKFIVDGLWKSDPSPQVETRVDNFGGQNSFHPARDLVDPEDWQAPEREALLAGVEIRQGSELEQAFEYARQGDYATAVALSRKVQDESGDPERAAAALQTEGDIHRRFGFAAREARCRQKICDNHAETHAFGQAARELAKYRLFAEDDPAAARGLYEQLLARTDDARERASILADIAYCHGRERQWDEAIGVLNEAMTTAPMPDGTDNDYAHLWTEMLMQRGTAYWRRGQYAAARADFEEVLRIAPWPDSQNAQFAEQWIERTDRDAAAAEGGGQ